MMGSGASLGIGSGISSPVAPLKSRSLTSRSTTKTAGKQWWCGFSVAPGAILTEMTRIASSYMCLWWVAAGHIPTIEEAKVRLEHLEAHGPTPHAFTFKQRYAATERASTAAAASSAWYELRTSGPAATDSKPSS